MAPSKDELVTPISPPPYEATAYAHHGRPRFNRRLRRACSFPVFLALILISAFSYICLLLERETSLRFSTSNASASTSHIKFQESLRLCAAHNHFAPEPKPESREGNPRWNSRGQNETIALRNATLFDGESFMSTPVDIVFTKGLIVSVSPASTEASILEDGIEYDVMGKYVTPGIVDMHSHHMLPGWPSPPLLQDGNGKLPALNPTCKGRC
jgi:hypothetical protein